MSETLRGAQTAMAACQEADVDHTLCRLQEA